MFCPVAAWCRIRMSARRHRPRSRIYLKARWRSAGCCTLCEIRCAMGRRGVPSWMACGRKLNHFGNVLHRRNAAGSFGMPCRCGISTGTVSRLKCLPLSGRCRQMAFLNFMRVTFPSIEETEEGVAVRYRRRHTQILKELQVDWIVNCTGMERAGIGRSRLLEAMRATVSFCSIPWGLEWKLMASLVCCGRTDEAGPVFSPPVR